MLRKNKACHINLNKNQVNDLNKIFLFLKNRFVAANR